MLAVGMRQAGRFMRSRQHCWRPQRKEQRREVASVKLNHSLQLELMGDGFSMEWYVRDQCGVKSFSNKFMCVIFTFADFSCRCLFMPPIAVQQVPFATPKSWPFSRHIVTSTLSFLYDGAFDVVSGGKDGMKDKQEAKPDGR